MSAYITRQYVENLIGPDVVANGLLSNGTTAAMTGSVMADFISSSCDFVDGFYSIAGYTVPVYTASAPPTYVADLAGYKVIEKLYTKSVTPVPAQITYQIQHGANYLSLIIKGEVKPPDFSPSLVGAPQGGGSFSDTSEGSPNSPLVNIASLRGTFI